MTTLDTLLDEIRTGPSGPQNAAFIAGLGPSRVWALANALVCVWIARVGLEIPPTRRVADRSNEA